VSLSATVSSCDTPEYRWWVRDPAAVWHTLSTYPATNPFTWTPASPGTYLVGVWARQTGSLASYEAYSFVTYTVQPQPASTPCTSANLFGSGNPPSPGATVSLSASATGCDVANYQFYIAAPSGPFVLKQAYSTTNSFSWDTTGLPEGIYQAAVLVRHAGSSASYETASFISQQLLVGATSCDLISIYPTNLGAGNDISSQSPQPAGTPLTWHVQVGPCSAELQFYVQRPGGSYTLVQAYSANAILDWNTAGLPRGTYNVKVLVRRPGKIAYENFAISSYELV
jgi:hypothetical protein